MDSIALILLFLGLVAFLYASVGHGGASGYLAVLTLSGFLPGEIKSFVLMLNFSVATLAFYNYYKAGFFRWKLFWPFALLSIPFAYLGSQVQVDASVYKKLIGVVLILSAIYIAYRSRISVSEDDEDHFDMKKNLPFAIGLGALIGFLSGIVGVGGGLFLSPLLLLLGWAGLRQTAATSAIFIMVNSLSGLWGLYNIHYFQWSDWFYLGFPIVWVCGYLGAKWGSNMQNANILRIVLSIVLVFASIILMVE
jgi:hypothetical protein